MRYEVVIYDADTDGDTVIIDAGDILVSYNETTQKIIVLKPVRRR